MKIKFQSLTEDIPEACESVNARKGHVITILEYMAVVQNLSDLVSMFEILSHNIPGIIPELRF